MPPDSVRLVTELRDTLGKMQVALNAIQDAIVWSTPDGQIQWFNTVFTHLVQKREIELLGKNIADVLPLQLHGKILPPAAMPHRRAQTGRSFSGVFSLLQDAGHKHLDVHSTLIEIGSDQTVVTVLHDLTERIEAETAMARARDLALESARLKSEFLANMSHEIRTPMNGVIGMTNLLMDTQLQGDQKEFVETIRQCGESLLTIINDILDFSKMEAGMLMFESLNFELRPVVESLVELLAERAHSKGVEFVVAINPDVPNSLRGDPGRLRQVLANLLGNALKFTEVGEVVLQVSKVSELDRQVTLRFDVMDTGIGISEEGQRRLFQPFSQADGSTTRRYGGTGLGLVISKKLVELMKGQIAVQSAPGRGSNFWFTCQFEKQGKQKIQDLQKSVSMEHARILVVDDNETNRRVLHLELNNWEMRNELADSGAEALIRLETAHRLGDPFGLAIIDMMMPEMDGISLARKMKADERFSRIPIILMTSSGGSGTADELREAGINVCLTKPVKNLLLHQCIGNVLSAPTEYMGRAVHLEVDLRGPTSFLRKKGKLSSKKILLAEDSLVNQKVALRFLEKLGFHADVVNNGVEVLEHLKANTYDLILMDCQMPEMDGFDATIRIRKEEAPGKHLPIIAMTAHAMQGDRERCLQAGMDDYLSKPVKPKELEQLLLKWLEPAQA